MTPTEFAFLFFGLLLGTPTGVALLDLLRARPRPRPEVRLTITHDAIPRSPAPAQMMAAAVAPLAFGDAIAVPVEREPDPASEAIRGFAGAPVAAFRAGGLTAGGSMGGGAPVALAGRPETPSGGGSARPVSPAGDRASGPGGDQAPADDAPCTAQRRIVEERCALARQVAQAAEVEANALRGLQRAYDEAIAHADRARLEADPREAIAAKARAQQAFRTRRLSVTSGAELEAAARAWLAEIDRVNRAMRDGARSRQREEQRAAELAAQLEGATLRADAARISAESAQQACAVAREALAACQEAQFGPAANDALAAAAGAAAGPPPSLFGERPETGEPAELAVPWPEPAIFRLLRGDRAALAAVVGVLAGDDPEQQRRWQLRLTDLVDAVVAGAIDTGAFDFPDGHPFWDNFSRSQAREIAVALSSLGYRYDGMGGIADGRVPGTRDLSMAIGYAGLDAMRIRRWPTQAEAAELYRDLRVAADEYLAAEAADLTLGQMIAMLGGRANLLTDVWDEWGRIRPLLLAPVPEA